uniref:DUF58 domain-containing protein n=1 Tax=Castellaniella defragrans TaxID=75697 RepID=UPI0033417FA7
MSRREAPRDKRAAARRSIAQDDGFKQLIYGLRWRVRGVRPGGHRGMGSGHFGTLRAMVPLERCRDTRRIDLHASLRDPFGRWYARDFTPLAAAKVCLLADLSQSMAFDDGRLILLADLCEALAAAARRNGDEFGLYACDQAIREDLSAAPRRFPGHPETLAASLLGTAPAHAGIQGLIQAAGRLAGARKLVFLVSDFEFPSPLRDTLFDALSPHDVVPVVLGDDVLDGLPDWGLIHLADLESGRRRLVWLRPGLTRRWRNAARTAARELDAACARFGWRVLRLHGRLHLDVLARHLLTR